VDGKIVADRQLTTGDRDSIGWTNDFIAVFNEEGILLSCDEIDENGKVLYSTRLKTEGNKIVKAENYGNDTLTNYQLIHYDGSGWIDRLETFTPADTLKNTMSLKNDEKGNLLSVTISSPLNDKKTTYEFSYNDTNRRSGYIFLNAEGVKTFEQKFVYNDHGFMEKQFIIDKEGKESTSQYTYSYSEDGNWIECIGNEGKHTLLAKREIEYY